MTSCHLCGSYPAAMAAASTSSTKATSPSSLISRQKTNRKLPLQPPPCLPILTVITRPGAERIVDIQEKKAISNKANTGAYVFPSAADLKTWAAENLDVKHPDGAEVGEYYTSQVISMMVQSGVPFIGLPLLKKDFAVVGTPEQLQELLAALKKDNHSMPATLKKRRFCFDLDMTLVGVPAVSGDYSTCPPISKNIRLVQQLYKAGHYIIIVSTTDLFSK